MAAQECCDSAGITSEFDIRTGNEAAVGTNVSLTPELESFAHYCVKSGDYNNVSEVVRSGLRLLKEQKGRKQAFNAMVSTALQEADEIGARTADDVLAQMDAVIEAAER